MRVLAHTVCLFIATDGRVLTPSLALLTRLSEQEPIFKEFDKDGNGFLDQAEISALVKKSLEAQREYLPEMCVLHKRARMMRALLTSRLLRAWTQDAENDAG